MTNSDSVLQKISNIDDHQAWAKYGWLSSDAYCEFWGKILATHLKPHLEGLHVVDVGAGNGRIWEEAFSLGLSLKHLTLIDPNLSVSKKLIEHNDVSLFKDYLGNVEIIEPDVFFFKQSFHLLSIALGQKLFSIIEDKQIIHLAMENPIQWPISDDLKKLCLHHCHEIFSFPEVTERTILLKRKLCFPVIIRRDEWIVMLQQRFISCLHAVDDSFIDKEIAWAKTNLPETLKFNDCLECIIFGS